MHDATSSAAPQLKPLLTANEFHAHLHGALGINAIRRLIKDGNIRSIPAGERKRLIPATELTNWPLRELERRA